MQNYWAILAGRVVFFAYCVSIFFVSFAREQVQIRSIEERQERVNGHQFLRRKKNIDGVLTNSWFIDGQSVEQGLFETQYADAAAQEALHALHEEERIYEEGQRFNSDARRVVYKKLLAALHNDACEYGDKIKRFDLRRFFVFAPETFSSEEDFNEAVAFLAIPVDEHIGSIESFQELEELVNKFELITKKMQQLFKATVERAINESSDTRVLKNLLTLVS